MLLCFISLELTNMFDNVYRFNNAGYARGRTYTAENIERLVTEGYQSHLWHHFKHLEISTAAVEYSFGSDFQARKTINW